jgi:alkylation response protein AidB-like acyl-CoA dehydrogenase
MDFSFSDDQRLLVDSLSRLLTQHYDFAARRAILATPEGWSAQRWADFAQMGLLGLVVPEEDGGFGGGAVETLLVMQALGRAMVLEPYLGTAILGATALCCAGHHPLLPGLLEGRTKLAFAHEDAEGSSTTAVRTVSGWQLDGRKTLVLHGAVADAVVVSAKTATDGAALFLLHAAAPGLHTQSRTLIDGSRSAALRLHAVPGEKLGDAAAVAAVVAAGLAAVCAEAVGAMETAYALTLEYLNSRQQFGRPIGRNQALQHRVAEMLVALEQARSMSMLAAMAVTLPNETERQTTLSQAKVQIGRSARFIGQTAIQLHGGIGVTEEYAVGHAHRRLMVLEQLFGTEAFHMQKLAEIV